MPKREGEWVYGPAVENGVPRYLSVSQIEMANDCLRKWHYDKIMGKKGVQSRAAIRGDNLHDELEKYLKTGDRFLSSLALGGMHMVPRPVVYDADGKPDLLIEQDMLLAPGERAPIAKTKEEAAALRPWADAALARAPLHADGIPLLGFMDLVHARGENKGATSAEDAYDPPGTIEVCDWKSAGGIDYIKKAKDLPKTIQMAGYASWVYRVEPAAHQVRLSHGYFVERGGPSRKVSLRVLREDVAPTWEHAEGVARMIRDAARETNPDRVDANTDSCDKYGGCVHKTYCQARMHKALASFIGAAGAAEVIGRRQENSVGLLDKMKAQNATGTPAANTTPTADPSVSIGLGGLLGGSVGAPAAPAQPDPAAIAAERAKLEAEEAAQRAAAARREAADKLRPFIDKFEAYAEANPEVGLPGFTGALAEAVDTLKNNAPIRQVVPGTGKLAAVSIADFTAAEAYVQQLDQLAANGTIKAPGTPTGNPLAGLGAPSTPAVTTPPPSTLAVTTPPPAAPAGLLASDAPAPQPQPTPDPDKAVIAPAPNKKKTSKKTEETPTPSGTAITLIVDGVVDGIGSTQSLRPVLEAALAKLAEMSGDSDVQAAGLREGPDGKLLEDKSPLGFNKWPGAVRALVREMEIPPGVYTLDTRGRDDFAVAASALADRCVKSGGMFFWGRR